MVKIASISSLTWGNLKISPSKYVELSPSPDISENEVKRRIGILIQSGLKLGVLGNPFIIGPTVSSMVNLAVVLIELPHWSEAVKVTSAYPELPHV